MLDPALIPPASFAALSEVPTEIAGLGYLSKLSLAHTSVRDLGPIVKGDTLRKLDLT